MSDRDSRFQKIRDALREEFPLQPLPAPDSITPHACAECDGVKAVLAGRQWDTLSAQDLFLLRGALPLLSADALAYFWGAFVTYALDHFDPDNDVLEMVIYSLTPGTGEPSTWEHTRAQLRSITRAQLDALLAFLKEVCEDDRFRVAYGHVQPCASPLEEAWQTRWS